MKARSGSESYKYHEPILLLMGLEVLILLRGEYTQENLALPATMACNITEEGETLLVPFPLDSPRYFRCDSPPTKYTVPPAIRDLDFEVILSDWESGCLDVGKAVVICGLRGEKLKPRYVRERGIPCQENILFYTRGYTRITAQPHGDITIERFIPRLTKEKEVIEINHEALWSGNRKDLPEELSCYKPAVEAAVEKANCPSCREPHYALSNSRLGKS